MVIELVKPQNAIKLLAGLSALFFEKLSGVAPSPNGDTVEVVPAPVAPQEDDLTQINGIGPAFARRLQEAGIDTYAKLAEVTPEFVKEAAKLRDWQGDPEDWIAQAKALA